MLEEKGILWKGSAPSSPVYIMSARLEKPQVLWFEVFGITRPRVPGTGFEPRLRDAHPKIVVQ